MATIIGNPYSSGTSIGQSIADVGKSMFGDTLTPALKRGELAYTGAKTEGVNFTNRSNAALQDLIANTPNGIEGLTNNPVAQSFLVGTDNFTPQKMADLNRLAASTNTANPITGGTNPISRAILGAGGSMESTPMGFGIDQSNKILMNNDDNATSRANNAATIAGENWRFRNNVEPIRGPNGDIIYGLRGDVAGLPVGEKSSNGITVYDPKTGQPLVQTGSAGSKLNQNESDLAFWAQRGEEANKILNNALNEDFTKSMSDPGWRTVLDGVAGLANPEGGLATIAANALQTPESQRYYNAGRTWVSGVLRVDTGAAEAAGEYGRYVRMYLPMPFDSPQTIADKNARRAATDLAMRTLSNGGAEKIDQMFRANGMEVPSTMRAVIQQYQRPQYKYPDYIQQPTTPAQPAPQPPSAPPMAGQAPVAAAPTRLRYNPATGGLE